MAHEVSKDEAGTRLDLFVARKMQLGRNEVKRLIAQGRVKLNGRSTNEKDKGLLLYEGSKVEVEMLGEEIVAQGDLPLVVLSEGDGWIAVEKPAGIAVHPLESGETGTLLNAVASRYPQIIGVGEGGLRSGVVHRLDVETSGVVLFGTNAKAWKAMREAFETHRAKKTYRAIVAGELRGSGREEMALIVAQHRPARVKVVEADHPKARRCDLTWRSIEKLKGATLVEIELGTGFLHQIRVMIAELGHPVVGDKIYGISAIDAPRQMLHASYVRAAMAHAKSNDPQDFRQILEVLG
jgi:23S rRNA pseudouridine1911/1915/1917 synthase